MLERLRTDDDCLDLYVADAGEPRVECDHLDHHHCLVGYQTQGSKRNRKRANHVRFRCPPPLLGTVVLVTTRIFR